MTPPVLSIRISDNVLEARDWPIRELTFDAAGSVAAIRDVHKGVYAWQYGPQVGWSISMVSGWSRYDTTGDHPEVYHEVQIGDWRSFVTRDQIVAHLFPKG